MERDVEYVPIIGKMSALKGFLSGSLMAGGLFVPIGAALQLIIFIIGFFVFLDTVIPVNSGLYAITSFFFLLIGAIIESALVLINIEYANLWLIVISLLTIAIYLVRFGMPSLLESK